MVRQIVVPFGEAQIGERAIAAVVGQEQRGNARRIGLERQEQHVEHELNVLLVTGRNAGRRIDGRIGGRARFFRLFECAFRSRGRSSGNRRASADRGRPISFATRGRRPAQNRAPIAAAAAGTGSPSLRWPWRPAPNSRSNTSRGFASGATGAVGLSPGQIVLIGTGITGIAIAGASGGFAR